jgi:signal transduction histidine kinase
MKRESKLVILVFLLVVGPAVLLSLFAVRVLNNWQVVLQNRLEAEAVRVLDQCVAAWDGESVGGGQFAVGRESAAPWVDGAFVFKPGAGLVYPPAESAVSSFVPLDATPETSLRAEALLRQATALRAAGKTNEAVEVLSKVAGRIPNNSTTQQLNNLPRDPDEGFYYDLIALKMLGDVEEARRRVLARYDDLVPLQRDVMVEFIEKPVANCPLPTDLAWQERMRGRALTAVDRASLAAEIAAVMASVPEKGWIRTRVAGKDALVGRGGGLRTQDSAKLEFIALQFTEGNLIDHLNGLFATATSNSSIRVVARSGLSLPPASRFTLHASRLPAPLESIVLEATPADPQAFLANARLQKRLYGVGGGLLLISVVAGTWLIWRQAAGEIREARERTEFAATVSHDLRTPLASMRMLAESLYMGNVADPAKRQTFLGAILKESDRLSRLTDRALYFIRYGQGALRYHFTEGDLASLVQDVVNTFAVGIAAKGEEGDIEQKSQRPLREENCFSAGMPAGVPANSRTQEGGGEENSSFANLATSVQKTSSPLLQLAIDRELPQVRFDDGAMEQVVFNLLDNAVKYSDREKGIAIEVSLEARAPRGGLLRWRHRAVAEVVLSVKDHGVGMAADDVRRVLKPYARGRGAAGRNARGLGLGLALCHHVVKAHGGRIEIESEVGKGTTFKIILPAAT